MGSVASTCIIPPSGDDNNKSPFGELPESVVSSIMTHLNPQDICRLAVVNKAFYAASSADFIWDVKLPQNYKTSDGHVLCKKDVYANLCGLNSLDAGTKKVSFDKSTGKPSVAISYNGLKITNFDDRRYWNRITTDESRFRSISYVQQTWWLEVAGEVEFPFPVGTYNVYYRLQLGRLVKRFGWRVCNQEHIHGWDVKPVKFQLSTSDGQEATSQCYLTAPGEWILYHAGSFVVKDSKDGKRSFHVFPCYLISFEPGCEIDLTRTTHYGNTPEVHKLKGKGFDFWSHVKKRIGNGADTRFWSDQWLGDSPLCVKYPRLFALEMDKYASVESKLHSSVSNSFRMMVRGGVEQHMLVDLHTMLESVSLSNSNDRWVFDLVSDGSFRVKETRNFIDDTFLPAQEVATRWVNFVPIKFHGLTSELTFLPRSSRSFFLLLLSARLPCLCCSSFFSYLLSFSFLLIDSCLSILACRLLLADSCLTTLACRLLLADSCLTTLACRLLLADSCLPTLAFLRLFLVCYLLQTRNSLLAMVVLPATCYRLCDNLPCLLTCDNLLLLSFFCWYCLVFFFSFMIILSSLAFCSSSLPLLLVIFFYLLSFSFLLLANRLLLADSCLSTLAFLRLFLVCYLLQTRNYLLATDFVTTFLVC
ncbi:F-box protein PP2-A12-like protein [Tanacetum coccineum]